MSEGLLALMDEAHETMMLLNEHTKRMLSAEADAKRLADALKPFGSVRSDAQWHTDECWEHGPTIVEAMGCKFDCSSAREALRQHREHGD